MPGTTVVIVVLVTIWVADNQYVVRLETVVRYFVALKVVNVEFLVVVNVTVVRETGTILNSANAMCPDNENWLNDEKFP